MLVRSKWRPRHVCWLVRIITHCRSRRRMPPRRLTHADVRRMALALPGVHEGTHMGHADLRVADKIFASLPNDPATVNMKITPANLDILSNSDPETFRNVWGGRWVAIALATVSRDTLRELLEDAWRLTAPKSLLTSASSRTRTAAATRPSRLSH